MYKLAIAAVAMATASPVLAASSVLYAADNTNLYRVNTSTGASTLVGATGVAGLGTDGYGTIIRDLAASSTTMYAAQNTFSATGVSAAIATINATTGHILTSAGLSGLLETGSNKGLSTLAYDLSTNTLYGTTSRRLYTFNATTGAASFIGLLPELGIFGLGFGGPGNGLYAISDLVVNGGPRSVKLLELNKVNASLISSVNLTNPCGCDIAFDPLNNQGFITSNFIDSNGNFTTGGLEKLNSSLTGSSVVGNFGSTGVFHNGLTFFGLNSAVPEPASWAMMIAGFGLVGGTMRSRKTRLAAA